MTSTEFLANCFWKATILLVAAFAASMVLRRSAASLRHFVWTAAFSALLLLPAAILLEPQWSPVTMPQAVTFVTTQPAASPVVPATPVRPLLLLLWMAGCLVAALRFSIGALRTSRMVRRATQASHAQTLLEQLTSALGIHGAVRIVASPSAPMPMVWGVRRPVVVLPEDAPAWPEGRLATVVLHELIHVRRRDLLAQAVAQAACCLYWFHPLAWLALSRQRQERERACDDAVLMRGIAPHDYAGHLMALVRVLAARRSGWSNAPAMAEASGFELRVRALLDRGRNRRPLSRAAAIAIASAIALVLLPIAAITARAQADRGAIAGVVEDPSGARVPNCRIVIKNLDTSTQQSATSGPTGEYQFLAIPSGKYSMEFDSPGFQHMKRMEITVPAGDSARVDAHLAMGNVTENVIIKAQRPTPAAQPAPAVSGSKRIRIGGSVQALRLIQQAKPVYPPDLQAQGIEGTVEMTAIVSKDGHVLNIHITKSSNHGFDDAANQAVKQWVYQPMLLNGEPVESITTITINFQLGQ